MGAGTWSKTEKQIARAAFEKASEHEHAAILREVHSMLNAAKDVRVVWAIHDSLSGAAGRSTRNMTIGIRC